MTVPREQREVLRYFHALVVIVATSAALLLGSIYHRYSVEVRSRDRLERFHLRTLMLTREIAGRVANLRSTLSSGDGEAAGRTTSGGTRSVAAEREESITFYAVGQALDSIMALQREYGEESFQATVERAWQRFGRIRQAADSVAWRSARLSDELDALGLTVYQLDRLHAIAVEDTLQKLADDNRRRAQALALAVALVLVVAGSMVIRLLVLLRERLRRYLETKEALLERERQLQQAQKMEALGTLVGGVAHDFNNLLTAILGHAEMMLVRLPRDAPLRQDLLEIQRAGERAAKLTRQLLTFSRPERAEPRVVRLDLLIHDIEFLLRRLIREDISLVLDCDEDLGSVEVNPVQMEQVLINLAVNAGDAMPQGGRLTIRGSKVEVTPGHSAMPGVAPGPYCRISVEDTGCGMSPEVRARAFDPYFTTKESGKGTGLGLAIAHAIVTKSAGHIFVESETGSGTKVDVYLPHRDAPVEGIQAGTENAGTVRGTETVLLVEDEDQVRNLTTTGLRDAGYQVIAAANGADALRLCREQEGPIHLILSDVVMPELRGPELVEQVRELNPEVGVVFMSGYTEDAILRTVKESGSPLVPKPFKLQQLLQVVRHELDARRDGEA